MRYKTRFKIKHTYTSSYHAQSDAKYERFNGVLVKALKIVCESQTDWASKLAPVLMSYRSTISTSTGVSPFFALFGRQMFLGIDTELMTEMQMAPDIQTYTANLLPKLKLTQDLIKQNLADAGQVNKTYYDQKSKEPSFELGSKVSLHDPSTKKGEPPKLKNRWSGPYLIVSKSADGLVYGLRHCITGKQQKSLIHANWLKSMMKTETAFTQKMLQ